MNPFLLRQFWNLVETTQSNILLSLDDASLIQWLLHQLQQQRALNGDETSVLNDYISSRLSLIRDLAQGRQALYQGFP
ncbi:MAG TPA: hypothetical protein V6D03_10755 [Candidatus Caenarcaniphilales bacterium]